MRRFENLRCLVTGAASGIGRESALRLAREGAAVAAADINADGLATLTQEIEAAGGRCHVLRFNALDESSCRALVGGAVAALGGLDVLCNIAGACRADHFLQTRIEDWERIFRINVTSLAILCQEALPELAKVKGNIVNMASASAIVGAPYFAAYAASKAAVVSLTKTLAVEFARSEVRVNAVCPGGVNTGLPSTYAMPEGMDMGLLGRLFSLHPQGEPQEIAAMVAYLASPEARYVSGAVFSIDGAQTA